ncbi:HAD family hydrolase [Dichotomicrobium thermohalophilum]|uniref:Haloacid dehalogenase-like hydrolase n=1 Tax=Dichotomicrobium thermohalophilum TaxID=933063 RepID=A0A397PE21_9HYPH|nr:HAD family hydrolase [Dichotomicrobium thermohalophilum]RIA45417.1 haloacid dehalogenase-like hydrolase [Dichotomicrobium thermohalophilum]
MLARYALAAGAALCLSVMPLLADPLPSWRDTEAKARIVAFVESVTDPASDQYVTPPDRIAVFDNDGTLWAEKPFYFQLLYAIDRVREKAEADPSILNSDALKAAANGDVEGLLAHGKEGLLEVLAVSHSGVSVDAFQADVRDWLESTRHPTTGMAYNEMLYQPMLELLAYLRDEDFSTWIVSGGGVHFIRAFAAEAYGIPPHQVVGSVGPADYEANGAPAILKEPGIFFINDKAGKPLAIDSRIGKRPIFAAGNSDGDFQMLEWTTAGDGPRFGMIVHHTDGAREFAYDRESPVGKLVRGLDEGPDRGWLIVDMAEDWGRVWPVSP